MVKRDRNSGRKDSLGRPIYESSNKSENISGKNKNALNPLDDFGRSKIQKPQCTNSELRREKIAELKKSIGAVSDDSKIQPHLDAQRTELAELTLEENGNNPERAMEEGEFMSGVHGDGFTVTPDLKHTVTSGFMVSVLGKEDEYTIDNVDLLSEDDLAYEFQQFALKNKDLFDREQARGNRLYVGGWKQDGALIIDVSVNNMDASETRQLGLDNQQDAYYDISTGDCPKVTASQSHSNKENEE